MKILVCSDSHGHMGGLVEAVEREAPDRIFFLGDHYQDGKELAALYPNIPIDIVRGNCDWGPGPDLVMVEAEGVRFLLTHGHLYRAKAGTQHLRLIGKEQGADVVCYGHTHVRYMDTPTGEAMLFNPGSIGGVRAPESYGILEVQGGHCTGKLQRLSC